MILYIGNPKNHRNSSKRLVGYQGANSKNINQLVAEKELVGTLPF